MKPTSVSMTIVDKIVLMILRSGGIDWVPGADGNPVKKRPSS